MMATRREFTRNQREEIVDRAKRDGLICCEGCGLVLAGKPYEIDHIIPEALRPEADKRKPLTIAEGQLLGKDCCHRGEDGKTKADQAQIAKSKRQNAKHLGITVDSPPIPHRPFQKTTKSVRREQRAAMLIKQPPRQLYVTRNQEDRSS
jgi:hypothetical protein